MSTPRAGSSKSADDPVSRFFAGLAETGHVATFDGQSATVRLDVVTGDEVERWHLTVSKGDVDRDARRPAR